MTRIFLNCSNKTHPQLSPLSTFDSKRAVAFAELEGIGHLQHLYHLFEWFVGRTVVDNNSLDEPLPKNIPASQKRSRITYNFATGRYELTVVHQVTIYVEGNSVAVGSTA